MDAIRKNLRDETGNPKGGRRVMFCPECGAEASAHAGDYWDVHPDYIFMCECGEPMKIGIPYSGIREVL